MRANHALSAVNSSCRTVQDRRVSSGRALPSDRSRVPSFNLLPDVLPQVHRAGLRPEDVAHRVRRDAFSPTRRLLRRAKRWNECFDRSVLDTADPNALPESRVQFRVRRRIGHVERVVRIDENPAWPAELPPLFKELAVRVENLDAAVGAVADEHSSRRIDRDRMGLVELARPRAFLASRIDELAVLRELHDARI